MNDNLVDLAAKRAEKNKPVTRVITHTEELEELKSPKETNLDMIRVARNLIENEHCDQVIIIARGKDGMFHTNHALTQDVVPAHQLWPFIGVLNGLVTELTDIAVTRAREIGDNGEILDQDLLEQAQ